MEGRQEKGPQQQASTLGLARQGGPWGRSYQPETRLQEGRKGNSGRGRDKEGSHAQHNGLPQGWDFAPTWPPVCSHSACKYLLMFIFLGRWVPSEALPMTHRSVCPRDPGSIQQGLLALFSHAISRKRHFRTKLPPLYQPGNAALRKLYESPL